MDGTSGGTRADWYPDPHGGTGVRWWDGDRWTDDTRPEHPRASATPPGPQPPGAAGGGSTAGAADGGSAGAAELMLRRGRLIVTQVARRQVGGPAYHLFDADGIHAGTVLERPLLIGGHPGERAATLDLHDAAGAAVLRLTRDVQLVASTCAAAGWPPLTPWGYVVLRPDHTPAAWVRAPLGAELQMAEQPWHVQCVEAEAPLEIRGFGPGTRRRAPRTVTMGGAPVAQMLLVSGSRQPDSYVLDLLHGPPTGALATTFAALVPLYDQIFRTLKPPVRASGGSFDASWGSAFD